MMQPNLSPAIPRTSATGADSRALIQRSVKRSAWFSALAPKALLAGAVFLLALWPRLIGLETYVTTDEVYWAGRSGNFARALASGRLESTFQTGHPGVTTMWAGLIGMGSQRAQQLGGERRAISRSQVIRSPEFLPGLVAARRTVVLATALATAGAALLTWRLLGPGAAVLGGSLLALDPFYLAHSQLLHVDALLATFMTLALLAGSVRWLAGGSRGYLFLSALATGLALLSKSPALFLLAFLPLVAAFAAWRRRELLGRRLWSDLLLWSALVGLTYVVCWPALWVAPQETLRGVLMFIGGNANPRHAAINVSTVDNGALFEGAESGALFYPATFVLRTTPLILIGLALLGLELMARRPTSSALTKRWTAVPVLLAYAVLFGLAMSITAKSYDRYLLPAFPVLDLLAGLGLALSARRLRWLGGAGQLLAAAFILPLAMYPLASSLPYPLTWYNPLAGGGPAAQRALTVGWGEGLEQVARYLNTKPNAERLKVALLNDNYTEVLDVHFVGQVMPVEGGDPSANDASYFITYIRDPHDRPPLYDARYQTWQPEFVVSLAGVEYSRVYDASLGIPLGARFENLISLEGYGLDVVASRPSRPLNVKLFWRALASLPAETKVTLTLNDSSGREVTRSEAPLGPLEAGQPRPRTYQLALPVGLAAGEYLIWVGVDTGVGQPLTLASRPGSLAEGAPEGQSRAVLRSIQVR